MMLGTAYVVVKTKMDELLLGLNKAESKTKSSTKQMEVAFKRVQSSVFSVNHAIATLAGGYGVMRIAKAFIETGITVDRLNRAMFSAVGSFDLAKESLKFLREESDRLGLVYTSQIKGFAGLAAAARGTALEGEGVKNIYLGIAEAGTALQLTNEEMKNALLATQQILSKGKVQAEELRGQLGERIPGAFAIAARSMGKTQAQLSKMLEDGKLFSEDFLPKFAQGLRENFGEFVPQAAQSAQASIHRLKNAWVDFNTAIMQSGGLEEFSKQVSKLNEGVTEWLKNNDELIKQKVPEYINSTKQGASDLYDWISRLVGIWKALPPEITRTALYMALMFKVTKSPQATLWLGFFVALDTYLSRFNMGFGQLINIYKDLLKFQTSLINLAKGKIDFSGQIIPPEFPSEKVKEFHDKVENLKRDISELELEIKSTEKWSFFKWWGDLTGSLDDAREKLSWLKEKQSLLPENSNEEILELQTKIVSIKEAIKELESTVSTINSIPGVKLLGWFGEFLFDLDSYKNKLQLLNEQLGETNKKLREAMIPANKPLEMQAYLPTEKNAMLNYIPPKGEDEPTEIALRKFLKDMARTKSPYYQGLDDLNLRLKEYEKANIKIEDRERYKNAVLKDLDRKRLEDIKDINEAFLDAAGRTYDADVLKAQKTAEKKRYIYSENIQETSELTLAAEKELRAKLDEINERNAWGDYTGKTKWDEEAAKDLAAIRKKIADYKKNAKEFSDAVILIESTLTEKLKTITEDRRTELYEKTVEVTGAIPLGFKSLQTEKIERELSNLGDMHEDLYNKIKSHSILLFDLEQNRAILEGMEEIYNSAGYMMDAQVKLEKENIAIMEKMMTLKGYDRVDIQNAITGMNRALEDKLFDKQLKMYEAYYAEVRKMSAKHRDYLYDMAYREYEDYRNYLIARGIVGKEYDEKLNAAWEVLLKKRAKITRRYTLTGNDFAEGMGAAIDDAKDEIESWAQYAYDVTKRSIADMRSNFSNAFYDMFSGGKDVFKNFTESMGEMFKKQLADMSAQAMMEPIIIPIQMAMKDAMGNLSSGLGISGKDFAGYVAATGVGVSAAQSGSTSQMVGAIVGGVLGAFSGPVGIAIGGAIGQAAGSFFDTDDFDGRAAMYKEYSNQLRTLIKTLEENNKVLSASLDPTSSWSVEFERALAEFKEASLNVSKPPKWFGIAQPPGGYDRAKAGEDAVINIEAIKAEMARFNNSRAEYVTYWAPAGGAERRGAEWDWMEVVMKEFEKFGIEMNSFLQDITSDIKSMGEEVGIGIPVNALSKSWAGLNDEVLPTTQLEKDIRAINAEIDDMVSGLQEYSRIWRESGYEEAAVIIDERIKKINEIRDAQIEAAREAHAAIVGGIFKDIDSYTSGVTGEIGVIENSLISLAEKTEAWRQTVIDAEGDLDKFDLKIKDAVRATIQAPFQNLIKNIEDFKTSKIRSDWTNDEYFAFYETVGEQIRNLDRDSTDYYDQALELYGQQFEALQAIQDNTQEALIYNKSLLASLDKSIYELAFGSLAPVQSVEGVQGQYDKLLADALSGKEGAIEEFQSFATGPFLEFMKAYGGDYAILTQSIIRDLDMARDMVLSEIDYLEKIAVNTDLTNTLLIDKLDELITAVGGTITQAEQYQYVPPVSFKSLSDSGWNEQWGSSGWMSNAIIQEAFEPLLSQLATMYPGLSEDRAYNNLFLKLLEFTKGGLGDEWSMTFADGKKHGFRMNGPDTDGNYYFEGFRYGGISTGPETGYEVQLHGTEAIVSQKNGLPVAINSKDRAEEIAELKKQNQLLREIIAAIHEEKVRPAVMDPRHAATAIGKQLNGGHVELIKAIRRVN